MDAENWANAPEFYPSIGSVDENNEMDVEEWANAPEFIPSSVAYEDVNVDHVDLGEWVHVHEFQPLMEPVDMNMNYNVYTPVYVPVMENPYTVSHVQVEEPSSIPTFVPSLGRRHRRVSDYEDIQDWLRGSQFSGFFEDPNEHIVLGPDGFRHVGEFVSVPFGANANMGNVNANMENWQNAPEFVPSFNYVSERAFLEASARNITLLVISLFQLLPLLNRVLPRLIPYILKYGSLQRT